MPLPSLSRLPRAIQSARQQIQDKITGFDRLKFWLDDPDPDLPAELLKRRVNPQELRNDKTRFHPKWQSKFDLFQPEADELRAFEEAIGSRYAVKLGEAELYMNWIAESAKQAMELRDFALGHVAVPYLKQLIEIHKRTVYFWPLHDSHGNKQPRNLVIYADSPDKRTGRPCCHIEWRFCGPAALGNIGLFTLGDCARLDHRQVWTENLHMFSLPSKAAISRWFNGDRVSGTTHRYKADAFLDQYYLDGAFVLQNCRIESPSIGKILKPIDNSLFLPE